MASTPTTGDNIILSGTTLPPGGVQFLVVEDNRVNQRLALKIFSAKAHRTPTILENGLLAVQAYKADPGAFRCILMDWAMPVMGGQEATREIRAFEANHRLRPCVIIAMIAGMDPEPQGQKTIEDGCDAYLTKPFQMLPLLTMLFGDENRSILHQRGSLTAEEAQSLSLSPRPPFLEPAQRSYSTRRKQARMQHLRAWSDCLACNEETV